ncbi:MAG: hypothetical protein J6A36_02165 [Clostridia bacterium]|nr:hypothetical protein [Clostridia bacterium]
MKVLFAVSSESISEAIIKRYQKEYKEILSYKNVYYFNAILKEIQKDKTYDRIVISEDLEPFSNNNYDTIDKFIFEKLDSISDEAQDSHGKDTSIILICTDRRVKGSSILVKLFGIGVYNALLGNDRSMDEVCKLINRPRSKKEAKIYYRIDSEDVNYKAENENEVSEVEIQNILAHFKKLGRNTAKYAESFNNIASQYTDEQLRIIVNCLPINVKAVLETDCERYQELMAVTGKIPSVKNVVRSSIDGVARNEISQIKIGQAANMTRPIVIPSAVRNAKNPSGPVVKKPQPQIKPEIKVESKPQDNEQAKVVSQEQIPAQRNVVKTQVIRKEPIVENPSANRPIAPKVPTQQVVQAKPTTIPVEEPVAQDIEEEPRRGRGRPRKTIVTGAEIKPKGKRGRPKKVSEELTEETDELDLNILPGFEETNQEEVLLPGLDDFETIEENTNTLPGFDDEIEEVEDNTDILPGFDDIDSDEEIISDDEDILPGFEDNDEVVEDDADILPGFDDIDLEDDEAVSEYQEDMLPGLDDETEEYEEYSEEELPEVEDYEEIPEDALPGLDDLDDIESAEDDVPEYEEIEEYDDTLPETEEYEEVDQDYDELGEEDYTDEVALPGLDDLDDDLESNDNYEEIVDEEYEEVEEDDGLLPGLGNTDEYSEEEETLLPGMGFEDEEEDTIIPQRPMSSSIDNNSLESIRPKVDYSMSSLNSLITKDKKIVTFIGTSKNGNSFLVNNLAALFSSLGINTAILDMTKNKNSYFIFTKNEEELRTVAYNSIEKLQNGYAEGVKVDKNLTVYTDVPASGKDYSNAEPILSTLVQNHSLILIDCDYNTDISYFASCQEMYLVQSMDILTIQPLTAFLRELKTRGVLEPEKIRVVINKEMKIHKKVGDKDIIGGLAYYNDPAMSFMTELFNKDTVKAISIPFDVNAYARYLGGIVDCEVSLNGYSKQFLSKLKLLGDMVYPLTSKQSYSSKTGTDYNPNAFSNSMNDTLNKMRKKY